MAKSNNFIQHSILGALSFLKESVFADEYALKKGLLQSLDGRVKTATLLLFIIQVMLVKNFFILLCFYALAILLAGLSRISLGFFLKRTWFFVPLFSLFIAIPALFSIFTPGEAIATLRMAGFNLIVTRQGLYGAGLFVLRVITSVSFAVLLSLTTRHFELLKVLRIFKIPQVFVMTLGMCYRYIFLFVQTVENTYMAVKSRVGTRVHYKKGQDIVAWNIASLWQRSYQMNEDVYRAMLSRGYGGEPFVLCDFRMKTLDWCWLIVTFMFLAGLNFLIFKANI